MDITSLPTSSLQSFLASRRECIAAGVNVGEIDRRRMRAAQLELLRRPDAA